MLEVIRSENVRYATPRHMARTKTISSKISVLFIVRR